MLDHLGDGPAALTALSAALESYQCSAKGAKTPSCFCMQLWRSLVFMVCYPASSTVLH